MGHHQNERSLQWQHCDCEDFAAGCRWSVACAQVATPAIHRRDGHVAVLLATVRATALHVAYTRDNAYVHADSVFGSNMKPKLQVLIMFCFLFRSAELVQSSTPRYQSAVRLRIVQLTVVSPHTSYSLI